jgi:hypothetical protein
MPVAVGWCEKKIDEKRTEVEAEELAKGTNGMTEVGSVRLSANVTVQEEESECGEGDKEMISQKFKKIQSYRLYKIDHSMMYRACRLLSPDKSSGIESYKKRKAEAARQSK